MQGWPTKQPFVSVIVPVRNEAPFIGATLRALLQQHYDPERFEVLVADGESTDATCAVVRSWQQQHANLRLLHNARRWSSAGRNVAIGQARGDILVVVDGHCEDLGQEYLQRLVDAFARSGADCVGRPQPLDVAGATPLQQAIAAARSSWLGHHPASHIYQDRERMVRPQSVAIAYRRAVFDAVGLFDESFDACEDVEFNHRVDRAGLSCFFTPTIAVRYYPRRTLRGLFQQMMRYGRGRVRLFRKHSDTWSVASFVPALFLTGLFGGALLAWLSSWLALAYCTALGAYTGLVALESLHQTAQARSARLLFWLPLVFVTIHLGAGAGSLQEWLTGWRPRRAAQRWPSAAANLDRSCRAVA